MRMAIDVTLGGQAFHVDEAAYHDLRAYLARLEALFVEEPGREEIMSDIESRLAELLRPRLNRYKQVILTDDLRTVLAVLGSPEDIGGEGSATAGTAAPRWLAHRFYRDPDERLVGGVCSGLAAHFSWRPLVFRILFVALTLAGSFGLWLYLILWLLLPAAETTAEKLEMRGDPVTIGSITAFVKNRIGSVRKKINL